MRTCGECTACCTLAYVPELDKPENVTCKNCVNGCSIYTSRPTSCVTYECEWLKGSMSEDMRPDKSGVMIEVYPLMVAALMLPNGQIKDIPQEILDKFDSYLEEGKPVIATGKFAKLPKGMQPSDALQRLKQTVQEVRN